MTFMHKPQKIEFDDKDIDNVILSVENELDNSYVYHRRQRLKRIINIFREYKSNKSCTHNIELEQLDLYDILKSLHETKPRNMDIINHVIKYMDIEFKGKIWDIEESSVDPIQPYLTKEERETYNNIQLERMGLKTPMTDEIRNVIKKYM